MTHQGQWQVAGSAPEVYERELVPAVFGAWAPILVELAHPRPGERVLDVACGSVSETSLGGLRRLPPPLDPPPSPSPSPLSSSPRAASRTVRYSRTARDASSAFGQAIGWLPIRLDQARIDRERFTADQPSRDAHRHYALKHPPQSITLSKALVPRAAEHRMIGDCVLDPELAKPPVGQIDFNLSANPPL